MFKTGALLLSVMLCAGGSLALAAESPEDRAESFSLAAFDGEAVLVDVSALRNGVVLFFFASWCKQSSEQVPRVQMLSEAGAIREVSVYGVSLQETSKAIRKFAREKKVTFPVLLDEKMEVAMKYGIQGIPTIVGIDAQGDIAWRVHSLPDDLDGLLGQLSSKE